MQVTAQVAAADSPLMAWFALPAGDLDRASRCSEAVSGRTRGRECVDGCDMAVFAGDGGPQGAPVQGELYMPGRSGSNLHFRVDDIEAVLTRAQAAGGRTLYPRKAIGPTGWVAQFEDSEGHRVALRQSR
jgi:predicted enzyme related to lactoylglutathione lyase